MKFALIAITLFSSPTHGTQSEEFILDTGLTQEDCIGYQLQREKLTEVTHVGNVTMETIFACEVR